MEAVITKQEPSTKITFDREVSLGEIGILKISTSLQKIIDYLHYKIGSTEWSGILFYKLTKGDIKDLRNLEFIADFLYPMNIGSSAYTEFDYSGDIIDAYDIYQEGIEQSTGLVHSHHSMESFFSGTDTSELKDNAGHYNFYISLIVNFAHEYCAKVAFPSKTTVISEFSIKDTLGKLFKRKSQKKENTLLTGDLKVVIEGEVEKPAWLENRVKNLEVKKAGIPVFTSYSNINSDIGTGYTPYQGNPRVYNDLDWKPDYSSNPNNNNFKKDWKTSPMQNRSAKFLSALISLKHTDTNANLYQTFQELNLLAEDELTQFEVAFESQVEPIHSAIYGKETDLN
jgi:hypothetical protein